MEAASILALLKHQKLDSETETALDAMKKKFLANEENSQVQDSVDTLDLPGQPQLQDPLEEEEEEEDAMKKRFLANKKSSQVQDSVDTLDLPGQPQLQDPLEEEEEEEEKHHEEEEEEDAMKEKFIGNEENSQVQDSVDTPDLPGQPQLQDPLEEEEEEEEKHHEEEEEEEEEEDGGDYRPPRIPLVVTLNGLIGECSEPFEKQLTPSDVKDTQGRLTMNKSHVETCILPLLNQEEDPIQGLKVTTYDMEGNEYDMIFKIWASKVYVLTKGWKEFYQVHGLRKNEDFVTIWMFRNIRTRKLCFVISSRRLQVFEQIKRRRLIAN